MEPIDPTEQRQRQIERVFGPISEDRYLATLVKALLFGVCISLLTFAAGAEDFLPIIGGLLLAAIGVMELVLFRPDDR